LLLRAQSREEILADKFIALAFRENRIKNRDLWDIAWLVQQGVELPLHLIPLKIHDHGQTPASFVALLRERVGQVAEQPALREDFLKEMRRFLPASAVGGTLENPAWWSYLCSVLQEQGKRAMAAAVS
jgi:hypothetical protein